MKNKIYNVEINNKYKFKVFADNDKECKEVATAFFNANNYFLEKEIKSVSYQVSVILSEVVNYKSAFEIK